MVSKVFVLRSTSEAIIELEGETPRVISLSPFLLSVLSDSLSLFVEKGAMSVRESFDDPGTLIYEWREV